MAERRITLRSQMMQTRKKKESPPVIPEEDEQSHTSHSRGTEKTTITKPKDATVEVTVKVKKRRDKPLESAKRLPPLQETEYRKGSWGDLLTSSKTALNRKDPEDARKLKSSASSKEYRQISTKKESKSVKKRFDEEHSPLCNRIPITDDLYLETHTHFRKPVSAEKPDTDKHLLKQNEELRKEIVRLRKEVESAKARSGSDVNCLKETPVSSKVGMTERGTDTDREYRKGLTQGTQTSAMSIVSPKKDLKKSVDVVDGNIKASHDKLSNRASVDTFPMELKQLEIMRNQNEELRQQITKLMFDINQTRSENIEFVNTIKELHQTADALTRANRELQEKHNLLILNHHGQQALQEQLLQIVSHNVQMKEALETLLTKQCSPTMNAIDDNQLAQFRNVIKDVKSTIAKEMQGLNSNSAQAASAIVEKDTFNSLFNLGESFLNDSNASEIRKILRNQPQETRRGRNGPEDGSSSTQYMNLEGASGIESSHFRPSPLAFNKYSPRISTPNSFSNFSMSLSEAGVSAFHQPNPKAGEGDSKWKDLEDQVSRSFIPLRNELSNCSTSSYSSGSASSSPNPIMMMRQ